MLLDPCLVTLLLTLLRELLLRTLLLGKHFASNRVYALVDPVPTGPVFVWDVKSIVLVLGACTFARHVA